MLKLKNNAKTTLTNAITAEATSLTVASASKFPDSNFLITIWNSSTYSDPGDDSNMEILLVTAVSGNIFTVTRAQESTVAKAHSSGHAVQMLITAGILEEIQDAIKDNFSELDDTPASYSGQGGKGLRVKGAENGIEFYVPTDLDEKIKISSNDTTAGYLNGKLVAGAGITLTEIGDGGDETLSIINNDKGSDAISTHEITYDHSDLHTQNTDTILQTDLGYLLDQSQTDHHGEPGTTIIGGNNLTAQTFTAGVSANIYSVKLWVYADLPNADLVLELQSTVGGEPSGVVLATESLPTSAFGYQEYTEEEFIFSPTYALVSGTKYALVCKSATTRSYYLATDDDQKLYANGSHWQSIDGGSNWTEQTGEYDGDTAFKVYVVGVGVSDLINDGVLKQNLEVDAGKTIDGRDISVDGTKLDTIETNADITDVANVTTALASITVNAHSDITSAGADIEDAVTKKHTQGTDTTLGSMSADINMNTHKLTGLSIPSSAGDSIRQTAKITEANLETAYDHSQIITGNPHAIDLTDLSTYDHKDLQNLQGGTTNEYYHLNSSEHTELTAWLDDVVLSDGGTLNLGTGKLHLRDTDIGIYSQADTFLDLFADGAVRIGDSSAGAPTNYTNFAPDGLQTMVGTARVTKEVIFKAQSSAKGSSAPTDAQRAIGASGGVLMPVVQFSKITQQDIQGEFHLPDDVDDSVNVEFHLMWIPGAAWTAGNYVWKLEYLVKNEGDDMTTGTPTTISMDVTPSNATDMIETEFSSTIDANAEQIIFAHFYRDVASDNGDDVGEVIFFEAKYTSNKLGTAT